MGNSAPSSGYHYLLSSAQNMTMSWSSILRQLKRTWHLNCTNFRWEVLRRMNDFFCAARAIANSRSCAGVEVEWGKKFGSGWVFCLVDGRRAYVDAEYHVFRSPYDHNGKIYVAPASVEDLHTSMECCSAAHAARSCRETPSCPDCGAPLERTDGRWRCGRGCGGLNGEGDPSTIGGRLSIGYSLLGEFELS